MEQHGVIFERGQKRQPPDEKALSDSFVLLINRHLGAVLLFASIIVFSVFIFSLTSAKKVSAIEPTPNEQVAPIAQVQAASPSAQSQHVPAIETQQQSQTEPVFQALPQPLSQPTAPQSVQPLVTPTPTPQSETVQATAISRIQSPLASYRSVSTYFSSYHPGVDLTDPAGTPVMAAASGVVILVGWSSDGYGMSVVIDHQNGMKTRYAHLSITNVSLGQAVSSGQVIGAVGCTGNCTGNHLHFEVIVGGIAQNPFTYLP
jgi:murein DD-endopeptidase MepM/ murein hydrolase activator NlpD